MPYARSEEPGIEKGFCEISKLPEKAGKDMLRIAERSCSDRSVRICIGAW
jgi:hypothetical protein